MLSISQKLQSADYHLRLANEDYYLAGGEPPGEWFGTAADHFGLTGQVTDIPLRHLFNGLSPDGARRLVQKVPTTEDRQRQNGWDLTFSAPKSVSVLFGIAPYAIRQEIREAHRLAVIATLRYMEEHVVVTRRGKGSLRREQMGIFAAIFEHGSSREQDAQLHSHVLVVNSGLRVDGSTGALVGVELFKNKMLLGALYRAELAHQLVLRLKLTLERVKTWFEVVGVPAELIKDSSKRRAQIETELAARGESGAVAAAEVTIDTRQNKRVIAREILHRRWEERGRTFGFGPEAVADLCHRLQLPRFPQTPSPQEAVASLLDQQSFFTHRELLRRLAERHQTGLSAASLISAAKKSLEQLADLGAHNGQRYFTTKEMLALEGKLLKAALSVRTLDRFVVKKTTLEKVQSQHTLSEEQRQALTHITRTPGGVVVVQGWAGTGKSTLLAAAREVWTQEGFKVIGTALAGKAALGLKEASKIPSETIDRYLLQWKRETSKLSRLGPRTVMVVDEAGMLGTDKLHRLVEEAVTKGAKLVLVGDAQQLPPISAGAPFAALGKLLGQSELTDIRRQKNPILRDAVISLAEGNIPKAVRLLDFDKHLRVSENFDASCDRLVKDWFHSERGSQSIMLGASRADVDILNAKARSLRYAAGEIGSPIFRKKESHFSVGDRVMFTRNNRLLGLRNGMLGTLTKFNLWTKMATFKLDTGKSVRIPIESFHDLEHGYALTTHKAQGVTVNNAYILFNSSLEYQEMIYTQVSRARHRASIYLTKDQSGGPNFAKAIESMTRSRAKELAMERTPEFSKLIQEQQELRADIKRAEKARESLSERVTKLSQEKSISPSL